MIPELSFGYIGFNTTKPPFSDKRVRKAIAHAIDRESIVNNLFFPGATLRCARDCDGRREQRGKCNGYFYQCKKCGATFGNIMTALDCPICKKRGEEKALKDRNPKEVDNEMPKVR